MDVYYSSEEMRVILGAVSVIQRIFRNVVDTGYFKDTVEVISVARTTPAPVAEYVIGGLNPAGEYKMQR